MAGLVVAGCRSARPSAAPVVHANPRPSTVVDLTVYHPSGRPGTRAYRQFNPNDPEGSAVVYPQSVEDSGRVEGNLVGRIEWPLSDYLDPHTRRPHRPRLSWPSDPQKRSEAFFVELDPPVQEWPEVIDSAAPIVLEADMLAYSRRGVPFARGTAVRRVWFKGYETVETGHATYADCARLRVSTEFRFGVWVTARVRESVWLARDVGVVRRTERISGRVFFVIGFDSTHEYELLDAPATPALLRQTPASPPQWGRLALYLDRALPRPRIGGLAVEWSTGLKSSPSAVAADGKP